MTSEEKLPEGWLEETNEVVVGHGNVGKFNIVIFIVLICICLWYLFAYWTPPEYVKALLK